MKNNIDEAMKKLFTEGSDTIGKESWNLEEEISTIRKFMNGLENFLQQQEETARQNPNTEVGENVHELRKHIQFKTHIPSYSQFSKPEPEQQF